MCLNTTITEDDEREPVETFIIGTSIIAGDATLITPLQRTITLIDRDSDQAVLAFERSTYVGTEAGPVEVCVVALQRLNLRDVEFTISSRSGSAFNGLDFIQSLEDFVIPPGNQSICGFLPIINDSAIEPEEFYTVDIVTLETVQNGNATIIIKNINAAVIVLESSNVSVLETDRGSTSEVSVCVTLGIFSDTLERNVVLVLNTVDETATGNDDYVPLIDQELEISFSILPGQDICQVLTIIGDDYEELNETFRVTFSPNSTLNPEDIIMGPTSVTVTIVDNGDVINCTTLEAPDNGTISGDSVSVGSQVMYDCDVGFVLSGDEIRTCQFNGNWTGSAPVCNVVTCTVDPIANGTASAAQVSYQSQVNYSCDDPFLLTGDEVRTCQDDGTLNGTQPSCTLLVLPPPTEEIGSDDDDDDDDVIYIAVGAAVGLLLVLAVIAIIIIIVCARSRRKKKSGKYAPDYVGYDHTLPEEVAVRENVDAEEPSDDYPEPPSTFHIPSPTAPEAPAEPPEKVDLGDEDEEVDEVEFRPHFSTPDGIPEKAYYLRELDDDDNEDEERLA